MKSLILKCNQRIKTLLANIVLNGQIVKEIKLLYRGSDDGFIASKFHELCDEKGSTLTIIKSDGYDRIFGGFTDIPWKNSSVLAPGRGNSFIYCFDS